MTACAAWVLLFFNTTASATTVTGVYFAPENHSWSYMALWEEHTVLSSSTNGFLIERAYPDVTGNNGVRLWVGGTNQPVVGIFTLIPSIGSFLGLGDFAGSKIYPDEEGSIGFSWQWDGRGLGSAPFSGSVLEVGPLNAEGVPVSLAYDFVQTEPQGYKTFGSVRYNSSVPLTTAVPIPEPGTILLVLVSVIIMACVVFRRKKKTV